MRLKTVSKLLVIGLVVVAMAGQAQAKMGGMGKEAAGDGRGKGMMLAGAMEHGMLGGGLDERHPFWGQLAALDLDEKQLAAVRELRIAVLKETIRKKADMQIGHLELNDLLQVEPVDLKAIDKKIKEIEPIRSALLFAGIKAREEIKALLTDEQKAKLKEVQAAHAMPAKKGGMACDMMGGSGAAAGSGAVEGGQAGEAAAKPAAAHH